MPITDFFGSVRPVELIRNVEYFEPLITVIDNTTKIDKSKTDKKPKKYRYVPPLVNFNSLIL